jgi:hypothetical protein
MSGLFDRSNAPLNAPLTLGDMAAPGNVMNWTQGGTGAGGNGQSPLDLLLHVAWLFNVGGLGAPIDIGRNLSSLPERFQHWQERDPEGYARWQRDSNLLHLMMGGLSGQRPLDKLYGNQSPMSSATPTDAAGMLGQAPGVQPPAWWK